MTKNEKKLIEIKIKKKQVIITKTKKINFRRTKMKKSTNSRQSKTYLSLKFNFFRYTKI